MKTTTRIIIGIAVPLSVFGGDWIVVRNRVSGLKSNNNEKISQLLNDLSKKLGFSIAPGMFERVIFRELFREGKTVFDSGIENNISYIVARSEVDSIVQTIFSLVKKRNIL
jgi:chromosome partitioning protein